MTVAESRQQRTDRASQAIGRLLLQAWTMLDQTCPNPQCGCVIMQAPNRGRKTCVLCGDLPLPGASSSAPPPASAPAPAPASVPAPVVDSAMNVDDDDEDMSDGDDDDVQMQLALETERQRARLLAASGTAAAPVLPATAHVSTVASTTVFEPSRLLGQRMLQGWTLLGDVCPRCASVPLVSKENVRECVACGPLTSSSSAPSPAPAQAAALAAPTRLQPSPTPAPAPATRVAPAPARVASPAPATVAPTTCDIFAIVQRKITHVAGKLDAADRVADIQHCAQVLRELLALQKELA